MNIKNCEKCGKIFNYIGRDFCPECLGAEEQQFEMIRNYIRKHPGCDLQEVTQNTEIPVEKVLHFLREGRLTGGIDSADLKCESCGRPISYGKICERCQTDLGKEITKAVSGAKKDSLGKNKMHTR